MNVDDIWWILSQSGNELSPCFPPTEEFGQYSSLSVSSESFRTPTIRRILRKDADDSSHATASVDRTHMEHRLLISHAERCWLPLMSLESVKPTQVDNCPPVYIHQGECE
jgi:hypothetical protein